MSKITNRQIQEILQEHLPEFGFTGELKPLGGGNINFVWRAEGHDKNLIIKHAPQYIATNPEVALSDSRIDFEARALKLFKKSGMLYKITGNGVRPPKLYAYDKEHSLIIMEDVGAFKDLNKIDIGGGVGARRIGRKLGEFIGNLHKITFQDKRSVTEFHNLEIQKVRNQMQYQPAWEYAGSEESELKAEVKKRSQDLGERLLGKGKCLVMGDLWPPSIFIGEKGGIRLIDWEFVHFGKPLQDVGHFAAHCWMQGQIEGATQKTAHWKTIWRSFLKAYKAQVGALYDEIFDQQELNDMGIHIATEILIRTFGPFRNGYIYEQYNKEHRLLQEARNKALDLIMEAEKVCEEFGF